VVEAGTEPDVPDVSDEEEEEEEEEEKELQEAEEIEDSDDEVGLINDVPLLKTQQINITLLNTLY